MKIRNVRNSPQILKGVTINPWETKEVPGLTKEEVLTGPLRSKVQIIEEEKPTWNRPITRRPGFR